MLDAESYRVLKFRCSQTARVFLAIFARQHHSLKFTLVKVVDEKDFNVEEAEYARLNSPIGQLESSIQKAVSALPELMTGVSNLVKRFTAPAKIEPPPKQNSGQTSPPKPRYQPDSGVFNLDEFDFTGWYCPCCGYGKETPATIRYFRCGRCGDYICGARIRQLPDGRRSFACHDRCGNKGIMGTGSLKSLSGMGVNTQKPSLLKDNSSRPKLLGKPGQLPAPSRPALPPSKKDKS